MVKPAGHKVVEASTPSGGPQLHAFERSLRADREEQQATRAAWLYFVAGLTQAQIGKQLGLNRIRVNRLLAQAREQGLVQIRITGRLADCVELEERIANRFRLEQVVVVPTPPDEAMIPHAIATAAGEALASRLKDGMSVGVGWGRTLRLSLHSVPRHRYKGLSVVSLLGGLTRGAAMNPHETASHLAELLDAQCYYVAAPAITDAQSTRDTLRAQPMIREVLERGAMVDLAFLSVGELTPTGTMARVGIIGPGEIKELLGTGAVGDICAYWIDVAGHIIDHPLNSRVMALDPRMLPNIPCVMIASGGPGKVAGILGVLNGRMANVLITDEQTARSVLALADSAK